MTFLRMTAGLSPDFRSPPLSPGIDDVTTEEAAVQAPMQASLTITPLVQEGESVARGAPVACLRHAPDVCLVAPIAGQVARISLRPGRRLSEIVLFRDPGDATHRHDAGDAGTAAGLRRLMQGAGLWPWLRRRPFGGMPAFDETPAAIMVMAADTRPFAPDPREALADRQEALMRGVSALGRLTDGPVFVIGQDETGPRAAQIDRGGTRFVHRGPRHPQASAGICIHELCPAGLETPVWDIHAEDVAALGTLLDTGELPQRRLVRIAGAGLREARLVRTHPGADLRQLTQRIALPDARKLMSGSPLDGHVGRWLAPRHRQITVLPREAPRRPAHWLIQALTRSGTARPAIPTAALTQAFAAALPAPAFVRALGAGDEEAAIKLGILSLLEEDVALADYVLSAGGELRAQLRDMLERIREELAA